MPSVDSTTGTLESPNIHHDHSTVTLVAAVVCLIWYIAVAVVCTVGYVQIWRYYSRPPKPISLADSASSPDVTIIRPVKGLEPYLYDCLASTFRQVYSPRKLHIRFCVSDKHDPALPVLERLIKDFPKFDAQIFIEEEDALLQSGRLKLGPNPKIRNMSRAYREAEGNIIWIVDCNVWIGKHTCGRMVQKLEENKFVHQLPLAVDTIGTSLSEETQGVLSQDDDPQIRTTSTSGQDTVRMHSSDRTLWNIGGGRLEELFLSSSHAKFYTAINTVLLAPCIIGKSTMFRHDHLNSLTNNDGIDYFSENICEDHLIGDLLWKKQVPSEQGSNGQRLGKHALCFGDLAIQPMSNMRVAEYWSRRVRWLRVRKFTVTLATLVEPGTESLLCSLYGAFAITTLPFFKTYFHIPQTWLAFFLIYVTSVSIWCLMDWRLYKLLHSGSSIHVDEYTPVFAQPPKHGASRRPFREWLLAWLGRELLAFPIWAWAFYGGVRVEWRGKKFWVGMDMRVHEISGWSGDGKTTSSINGDAGKTRQD